MRTAIKGKVLLRDGMLTLCRVSFEKYIMMMMIMMMIMLMMMMMMMMLMMLMMMMTTMKMMSMMMINALFLKGYTDLSAYAT